MLAWTLSLAIAGDCAECHASVAAEWATSRHAVAATNPLFRASARQSPYASWCRSCHAPLGQERRAEGVGCESCHVRDEGVVSSSANADADPFHTLVVDEAFVDTVCATCHQFGLPTTHPQWTAAEVPVQNTVDEHDLLRDGSCVDCHDPHEARGGHDEDLVRSAIHAEAERRGEALVVTVQAENAGHRVPTGDPFRRLTLRSCGDLACDVVWDRVVWGRHFGPEDWILQRDDTLVPGEPRTTALTTEGDVACWELRLDRAEPHIQDQVPEAEATMRIAGGCL